MRLEYASALRHLLTAPLRQRGEDGSGVQDTVKLMQVCEGQEGGYGEVDHCTRGQS